MKTSKILTVTVVMVALLATAASAQSGRGRQGRHTPRAAVADVGPDARLDRLADRLDLTDDQQAAIEALREASRKQCTGLRKDLARLQNELRGEMLKDTPSESVVVGLTERMGALRTDLRVIRVKTRLAVRSQLTDEQRDRMMLMGKRGGRDGRRGARCLPGDGPRGGRGMARNRDADL